MSDVATGGDPWAELFQYIRDAADTNQDVMDGTLEAVFDVMDAADIVCAVYPNPKAESGFGYHVAKGIELVEQCTAAGRAITDLDATWTGMHCLDEAHAIAIEESYATLTGGRAH